MKTTAFGLLCLAVLFLVGACGAEPSPTPDGVATQVAQQQAVAATLTAAVPTRTVAPSATATAPAPTHTASPLPSATRTLAPSPAASATSTPPPAPTLAPTRTPQPTATPPVTWKPEPYTVVGVAPGDVLNVRAGPGVDHAVVGTIPPHGMGVQVGEPGQKVGPATWVPVWYRGITGWSNRSYLAQQVGSLDPDAAAVAARAIMALRDRDMETLAALAHPEQGIRFSPYTYVTDEHLVFSAAEIPGLLSDPAVYLWGTFDGSGAPIEYTFLDYYGRFVYDVDFAQPEIVGFDETVGRGNTLNNIAEYYPGALTVEYHFSGFDPQYGGMDWKSLRLVLSKVGTTWVLVGIVHDEWTI